MMFAVRAIAIFSCALLPLLAMMPACVLQSRMEDRTDNKIEAKENAGKPPKLPVGKRTVWNLDGGVFFVTDGHLQNGACFRLSGHLSAADFFEGLRRVDTEEGTSYRLRNKVVTEYPEQVEVVVHVLDFPCSPDLKEFLPRPPLTRETMSTLRLNFFWKDGVHLRPVEETKRIGADIRRLSSYAIGASADELAPRFEWNYAFTVNSDGVPLTDDLVLVIKDSEQKICARVAARL